MTDTSLFKIDGYESPKKLIKDFCELASKEGLDAVLKKGKYKLDREKWVAGMTCIGMTKLTGRPWFVKPADPKEQTPDFRAAGFDHVENEKYIIFSEVECEIVYCPKDLILDGCQDAESVFLKHLEETKFCKAYPSNYVLIVLSQFEWKNFSLEKLAQLLAKRQPRLWQIWSLMNISQDKFKYLLAQLFPQRADVEIDTVDLMPNSN